MKYVSFFAFTIFLLIALPFAAAQESTGDDTAQIPDAVEESVADDTLAAPALPLAEDAEQPLPEDTVIADAPTLNFVARLGIALGVIAVQILLIWLVWRFFKMLSERVVHSGGDKIKPLTIKKLKIISAKQIIDIILFSLRILRYLINVLQVLLTLPIVFSLFPATRHLAATLFGYILNPLKNIGIGILKYIPNVITIIIIVVITRYVLKALKFFALQITKGKLVIPGFYVDWAAPTYRILQVLLWAFTIAIVYPYLPGSDSKVFQGVSVFLGIIFSLGSTSAIGNLVAGLVITYMRPFKIGDRVQIKEVTGFVVEKNLMVVRLKTHKNEYVTFPNLIVLGSSITNYHTSSDENTEGLILNTEITFGYATPWQTVHEILIQAALATKYVQKTPKPFVLQTGLDDFYARYQINCYTKEIDRIPAIYTELYENIQNGFNEAGLDMTAPHYEVSTTVKG